MSIIVFILQLIIEVCTTIGLYSIIYVIAKQPITSFTVIVWSSVSLVIRIGIKIFECSRKENKKVKEQQEEEAEVIEEVQSGE